MNNKEAKQYVFEFECSEVWEKLTESEEVNIRHCQRCDKNVHLVQNYDEFISNAEKGNCIYSPVIRTAGIPAQPEELREPQTDKKPKFIKRIFQFTVLFAVALPIVSFLPLYIQRTMTRSQVIGNGGDVIKYGWKICTLYDYLSDYKYFRPEDNFYFWIAVNLGLACVYAFVITLFIILLLQIYRKRRKK